jgi:hypothetical protein
MTISFPRVGQQTIGGFQYQCKKAFGLTCPGGNEYDALFQRGPAMLPGCNHPEPADTTPVCPAPSRRFAPGRRLRGLAVAIPCWAILAAGAMLHPASQGYGTHEQLGLPACAMMTRTGYPCPTCGVTTAFASATRGRLLKAFWDQPFGVFLFAIVLAAALAGTIEAVSGKNILSHIRPRWAWLYVGTVAMLAGWAWKLVVGILTGELPVR